MIDKSFRSAGMTFPARLILGGDQFFSVMRYNEELYGLAYRQAHKQSVAQGLQGAELSAHIARLKIALRGDPTVQAAAAWTVLDESWSRWEPADSELPRGGIRKLARLEEKLLSASRWRSVSEITDFPFASFPEMLSAVAARRCYISVTSTGFRFTNLTSSRAAQAFSGFLSWVPFLVVLASVVAAIALANAWILVGIPAAVFGFVIGTSSLSLVRPILLAVQRSSGPPLRIVAGLLLVLFAPIVGTLMAPTLFGWMLFTDRQAAAWVVASYMLSVHAIRVFRARGTVALCAAAKTTEAFFLFALSQGLCGLRDKATGEFLRRLERPQ